MWGFDYTRDSEVWKILLVIFELGNFCDDVRLQFLNAKK